MTEAQILVPATSHGLSIIAIWDTGASGTAISKNVVDTLGLLPTGIKEVHTANGKVIQNTYFISIGLPNNVIIQGIVATEVPSLSGGAML
ncbi:MAG: retroviral-like aspartic protease family protein [Chitinophagales bacterium]|nr:retroviral-like aspartic protease family protein [Chitinophagales bacterium]